MLNSGIGTVIEKTPDELFTAALEASLSLITQLDEGVSGTVHKYEPEEAGVEATMVVQFVPLSGENSSFTLVTAVELQVRLVCEPVRRFIPCRGVSKFTVAGSGAVTVTVKLGAWFHLLLTAHPVA